MDPTVRGGYDFLDVSLMQAGDNAPRPPPHVAAAATRALARAGVLRATSVRVRHCAHAYALVLTVAATAAKAAAAVANASAGVPGNGSAGAPGNASPGGSATVAPVGEGVGDGEVAGKGGEDWKLVYSGDCRPSDALVEEGKGAAVLIHEATFDESKQQVCAWVGWLGGVGGRGGGGGVDVGIVGVWFGFPRELLRRPPLMPLSEVSRRLRNFPRQGAEHREKKNGQTNSRTQTWLCVD